MRLLSMWDETEDAFLPRGRDGRRELVTFEEKITCGKSYKKIKESSIR